MTRRHSWLPLAGACALFAACGPAALPEELATQASPMDATHACHRQCRPPVLTANLFPDSPHESVLRIIDLDGTPLVFFEDASGMVSLWKLEERTEGRCGEPTWDAVLVKSGLTGLPSMFPFATVEGTCFFRADDGEHGVELWKSDGTPEGTRMVRDIHPSGSAVPFDFFVLDGMLYFSADDGVHGRELWRSNGTAGGTRLVEDIRPGLPSSDPRQQTVLNDHEFLLSADDGVHGRELWKSNGTAGGTRLVEDIRPGPASSDPGILLQQRNDQVLFAADDGIHGRELWKSDGTAGGTRLVEDIRPGPEGADIEVVVSRVALVGHTLYFSADDGVHGPELWKSNGTAGGTRLVEDILPGPEGSFPFSLLQLVGGLYFVADDGIHGREPWRSHGSSGSTRLLEDVYPGPTGSEPTGFAARGRVFFHAIDPVHGRELWVTRGTSSSTHLVKDTVPGPDSPFSGDPNTPFAVGAGLIFVPDGVDGTHGIEPWWTDGTEDGTMVADLNPGPEGSFPSHFERSGRWVYFSADDGRHGLEVWALPVACFPKAWESD